MKTEVTTAGCLPQDRSRHWHDAIAGAYFPLDLEFRDTANFSGELKIWPLGELSLSRLTSDPLEYRRMRHHLRNQADEHFLITVPTNGEIFFAQSGKDVRCQPGGYIVERSHEPYVFSHRDAADLWVVKVAGSALSGRVRQPDRFCSMQFDAAQGAGGLFCDMLHLVPARYDAMSADVRAMVGRQLIDLLVLALQSDERALASGQSTVRQGHLMRIEAFIRRHLNDPALDPDTIARGCGISTRYLHELFRDTNHTLGSWIRDQRLEACRAMLADGSSRQTIAEIAYDWGFGDQAQFSRAFKAQFGQSPKEFRDQSRRRPGS